MANLVSSNDRQAVIAEGLDSEIEQLVTLVVDNQVFGIPILQVQDIVEPKNITNVPRAPVFVSGVLNLRGRIVTVIDLHVCLERRESHAFYEGQLSVTVEYQGDLYTLLIDDIGDILNVPIPQITKVPKNLEESLRDISSGIVQLDEDLVAILSIPMLFKKLQNMSIVTSEREIANMATEWRHNA